MADLLADPTDDLEEILRDACGHLARSLDLLSRVVHPPPPGEIGPISVREPVDFVTDLQRAGRTHVRLEVAVDPALPAASGIARHLEHALLNLILYVTDVLQPHDTGVVRIGARDSGTDVRIAVGWDGPPVPAEEEGRLFELRPDIPPAEQPLAIGLAVAREVLRLSGGTLTYSANAGPGPCFLLTLPKWRRAPFPGEPAGSR